MRVSVRSRPRKPFYESCRVVKRSQGHKTGKAKFMILSQKAVSIVLSGSAPVAQLDRASDFESYFILLQVLTIFHITFDAGYLTGFREILPK